MPRGRSIVHDHAAACNGARRTTLTAPRSRYGVGIRSRSGHSVDRFGAAIRARRSPVAGHQYAPDHLFLGRLGHVGLRSCFPAPPAGRSVVLGAHGPARDPYPRFRAVAGDLASPRSLFMGHADRLAADSGTMDQNRLDRARVAGFDGSVHCVVDSCRRAVGLARAAHVPSHPD